MLDRALLGGAHAVEAADPPLHVALMLVRHAVLAIVAAVLVPALLTAVALAALEILLGAHQVHARVVDLKHKAVGELEVVIDVQRGDELVAVLIKNLQEAEVRARQVLHRLKVRLVDAIHVRVHCCPQLHLWGDL